MRFPSYPKIAALSLLLGALAASGAPKEWRSSRGALTTTEYRGATMISARQFCFAMGCKVLYNWPRFRAVIENPAARLSAVITPLAGVALAGGNVVEFAGTIVNDPTEGYLLPMGLAQKLAVALQLGRVSAVETPRQREAVLPAGPPAPPEAQPLNVLVIDPGHGGNDLGTTYQEIQEKDVALMYAFRLREELGRQVPDLKVYLTRDTDRFISLPDRAKFANARGANFFMSLHLNHAPDARTQGAETYILSPDATDDEARRTALLENESWLKTSEIRGGADDMLKQILADMEVTKYIQGSALAASLIQQELGALDRTHGLKNRGVKQAMFFVLSQVAMPSVLLEMGFLSSPGDRGRLMNVVFRDELASRVVSSLKRYREKRR